MILSASVTLVTFRLFFYGLVAFTPGSFQCDSSMKALLIDARTPPIASDGCPIHAHTPALFFANKQCQDPCREERGLCRCPLDEGFLLDIGRAQGQQLLCQLPSPPTPKSVCASSDFKFMPNLANLQFASARLKRECDRSCPDLHTGMCKLIAAQINFQPNAVTACALSPVELSMRPLASRNIWQSRKQKTLEIVVFTFPFDPGVALPTSDSDPVFITLAVRSFDGGESYPIRIPITFDHGAYYADLVVANFMNERDHEKAYARCSNDLTGRDFELYQDLTTVPQFPLDRAIPQASSGTTKTGTDKAKHKDEMPEPMICSSSRVLQVLKSQILRAGKTRPICPEATIDPETTP